jgi:hypothetical protein
MGVSYRVGSPDEAVGGPIGGGGIGKWQTRIAKWQIYRESG